MPSDQVFRINLEVKVSRLARFRAWLATRLMALGLAISPRVSVRTEGKPPEFFTTGEPLSQEALARLRAHFEADRGTPILLGDGLEWHKPVPADRAPVSHGPGSTVHHLHPADRDASGLSGFSEERSPGENPPTPPPPDAIRLEMKTLRERREHAREASCRDCGAEGTQLHDHTGDRVCWGCFDRRQTEEVGRPSPL